MTVADQYEMSPDGLRRLHQAIERDGLMAVGLACGHPPAMAQRASAHRFAELKRKLGIDDPAAL
ncbi:hypothetical protein [Synechococcus sp. BO 8801]|uniref:hypothetical protein n=1 Tax=Synechococcus sp. BO 8801 TaxID=169670 RepID=UPI000B981CC3|nr:hypothetical protein [Synechococcus sp. BO 8801]